MMTLMVPLEEMKKYVHVKTVSRNELDYHTEHGWRLVALVAEQTFETESRNYGPRDMWESYERATQNNYGRQGFVPPPMPIPLTRNFYLVGQDENQTILALAEERDAARKRESNANQLRYNEEKALKAAQEELAKFKEGHEIVFKSLEVKCDEVKRLTETVQKMEADLAKVRKAIGDRKWKEILS